MNVAKKRTNIIPIIEDARHPHKYRMLVRESRAHMNMHSHSYMHAIMMYAHTHTHPSTHAQSRSQTVYPARVSLPVYGLVGIANIP